MGYLLLSESTQTQALPYARVCVLCRRPKSLRPVQSFPRRAEWVLACDGNARVDTAIDATSAHFSIALPLLVMAMAFVRRGGEDKGSCSTKEI
jgi:hypothetical protein